MIAITPNSTHYRRFSTSVAPDSLPTATVYADNASLGAASVAAGPGTNDYRVTIAVPSNAAVGQEITVAINWIVDGEPQSTTWLWVGVIAAPYATAAQATAIAADTSAAKSASGTAAAILDELTEITDDQIRLTAKALEAADADLQPVLDAIADLPAAPNNLAVSIASLLSALSIRRLTERPPLVTDVMLMRGTDWRIPITVDGLPDDWTRIELTARRHNSDAQSQSLLHIVLSNPAADSDGLQILSGSPAADPAAGAIAVTDGQAIATVTAAAVAEVDNGEYCWDSKVTSAAGIEQVARGTLFIERDVTRLAVA